MKTIKEIFKNVETHVSLPFHDIGFRKKPKSTNKKLLKSYGFELKPALYHPISIQWIEKERGFGEYHFWEENGQIFCHNECDSKETVKRILCKMVDQAYFLEKNKRYYGYLDDDGVPIFEGDILVSKYNYEIEVCFNYDEVKDKGDWFGKLICDDKHSCKDIPYHLNKGKGYKHKTKEKV